MKIIKIFMRFITGDWWEPIMIGDLSYGIINKKQKHAVIPEEKSTKKEAVNACRYLNITRYLKDEKNDKSFQQRALPTMQNAHQSPAELRD